MLIQPLNVLNQAMKCGVAEMNKLMKKMSSMSDTVGTVQAVSEL
jgi:hypothetical protein